MYIIGAGLSGLSGAINALKKKMNVEIYESAKFSGGRCRSFFDKKVNIEIDNGNHLVFSANENFIDFCKTIGTTNTLKEILLINLRKYLIVKNENMNDKKVAINNK